MQSAQRSRPIGYLLTLTIVLLGTLLALRPLRRSRRLGTLSWLLSAVLNESPSLAIYWLAAVTALALAQGDVDGVAAVSLSVTLLVVLGAAPILTRRALRARAALQVALDAGLGSRRPRPTSYPTRRRLPWLRIVLAPLPVTHRGVRRRPNLTYGPHGRRNRLDVYRGNRTGPASPVLVHLHGGGFRSGRKSFYARAMLHELAGRGWVCISANYRLRPASFSDMVSDVERVIAWTREHADELDADPSTLVLAGSSAGAHLATTAGLTASDHVSGVVGLYGYYGRIEPGPTSPADHVHRDAPPVLLLHGAQDTFVPAAGARELASRLRAVSRRPAVYVELPGAQHSFDLVRSVRFELVIRAVEDFLAWVHSGDRSHPSGEPS